MTYYNKFLIRSIVLLAIVAMVHHQVAASPSHHSQHGNNGHNGGLKNHAAQSYSCSKGCGMSFDTAAARDNHESGCSGDKSGTVHV
jgi:hypothetical protein